MPSLAPTQSSDCATPVLDINLSSGGAPVDVAELEYVISEKVTTPATPIQVFPPSGRATTNVGQDCPTGDRLSTGRYVAQYLVPGGALIGTYQIEWFWKLAPSSAEQCWVEEFEVLPTVAAASPGTYCTVSELRDEGVNDPPYSDAYLSKRIELASRYIDRWTGRYFSPVAKTIKLDGKGTAELMLLEPVIEITAVQQQFHNDAPMEIDLSDLRVYNRHISQNLTSPDDRNNPRIGYLRSTTDAVRFSPKTLVLYFVRGSQNITVTGTFGYTDYDGSSVGKTPDLICRACVLLVVRNLPKAISSFGGSGGAGTLRREKTRHQEAEWGDPAKMAIQGAFTGDPEIDQILASYRRPMFIGSA